MSDPNFSTGSTIQQPNNTSVQDGMNIKMSTPNVVFRTSGSSASNFSGNTNGGINDLPENRLNGPQSGGDSLNPAGGNSANMKKTSFQITSVTVDSSASNDGGDDSGDDVDESHTEDSSDVTVDLSRQTSESLISGVVDEKFTRNDIFYNPAPPSSINTAPVIPTSSQYGLAIVPDGVSVAGESTPSGAASLAMNQEGPLSGDKIDPDREIVHNRFKVVKIVSNEPFKKGRWVCMDYFDHTTTTSGKDSHQGQAASTPQSSVAGAVGASVNPSQGGDAREGMAVINNSNMSPPQVQPVVNVHETQSQHQQQVMPSPQAQSMINMNSQQQMPPQIPPQQTETTLAHNQENVAPNGDTSSYSHHYEIHSGANHIETPASYSIPPSGNLNMVNSDLYASNPIPTSGKPATSNAQLAYQPPQQQYYAPSNVMSGMPSNASVQQIIPAQQSTMPISQPSHTNQQQPIVTQMPPQSGTPQQINPQNQIPPQQMQQMQQQQQQPQHMPAQSLPHGAHAAVIAASANIGNTAGGTGCNNGQPQQQQPHTAQSLGHNMLQSNTPAFMTPNQNQQQQGSFHQQLQMGSQPYSPQQQQQSPNLQGMIVQQPQGQPQQMQMGTSQAPVLDQSNQSNYQYPNTQTMQMQHMQQIPHSQAPNQSQMYAGGGQMMGQLPMSGTIGMQQQQPQIMNQQQAGPQQIHGQMMQQPMMNQQHQPIMNVSSQGGQASAPPQSIIAQPQMVPQMIQGNQMMSQPQMATQQGVIPQAAGNPMVTPNNVGQQPMMQSLPQQTNYPQQNVQSNIQPQPMVQQFSNPQPQQPTIMNPQPTQAPHMPQSIPQNQSQPTPVASMQSQSHPQPPQQSQAQSMTHPSQPQQQQLYQQHMHQQLPASYNNAVPQMHQMVPSAGAPLSVPMQQGIVGHQQVDLINVPHSQPQEIPQHPPPQIMVAQQAPPQQVPIPQQENHNQLSQNQVLTPQQNSANLTPPQQSNISSLSAAASVIVEGISSAVNEAAATAVNEDGERALHP